MIIRKEDIFSLVTEINRRFTRNFLSIYEGGNRKSTTVKIEEHYCPNFGCILYELDNLISKAIKYSVIQYHLLLYNRINA